MGWALKCAIFGCAVFAHQPEVFLRGFGWQRTFNSSQLSIGSRCPRAGTHSRASLNQLQICGPSGATSAGQGPAPCLGRSSRKFSSKAALLVDRNNDICDAAATNNLSTAGRGSVRAPIQIPRKIPWALDIYACGSFNATGIDNTT